MLRLTGILCVLGTVLPCALAAANVSGVYGIVERRIPQHAGKFTFEGVDGEGDTFVISDTPDSHEGITVSCTTTSACARGLYTCVK